MTSFLSETNFIETNIQCMDFDNYINFMQSIVDDGDDDSYKVAINTLQSAADKDAGFNVLTYKFKYSISEGYELTISDVIDAKGKTTREVMNLIYASLLLNTAILPDTDPIYFQGINERGEIVIEA